MRHLNKICLCVCFFRTFMLCHKVMCEVFYSFAWGRMDMNVITLFSAVLHLLSISFLCTDGWYRKWTFSGDSTAILSSHCYHHATVMCSVLCRVFDLLYSWLFPIMVVNKNSLNYCSSSDKSKRRTKTVKKSLEPKWNQTFMYSPVHRREFRERMLEITLWDQARVREEESEFLGEVRKPNTIRQGHSLMVSQLILLNEVQPIIKVFAITRFI